MTVMSLSELGTQSAILEVEREGIRFWSAAPDRVRIEITVHNRGTVWSQATPLVVQSAPLGAFLPWRPLVQMTVPPIAPESQARLQVEVNRTPSAPLGDPARVPPATVLTALDAGDADDADTALGARRRGSMAAVLARDIFELLGHRTVHWAGNINVFVHQHSVERHLARVLRIHPGKKNLAVFMVGTGRDKYAFELEGMPLADYAALADVTSMGSVQDGALSDQEIRMGAWLPARGPLMVALLIHPPSSCQEGELAVHVREHSTGHDAVVEFSFDARAAGPGCFTV